MIAPKSICLLICLSLFAIHLQAQTKTLLEDKFNNNKNGWLTADNADFKVGVKDGVFHLEKLQKNFDRRGCLWLTKPIPGLNTLNDFSVTLYARFLSGGDIMEQIDLMWGTRTSTTGNIDGGLYKVTFFMRGEVWLDFFDKKWTYFVKKKNPAIIEQGFRPGDLNKYEFIQKDSFVIIKVNNQELLKQKTEPKPGNSIGFQQCLKCAWEIDKIIVQQEEPQNNKPATVAMATILNNRKDSAIAKQQFLAYPNPFSSSFTVAFSLEKESQVQLTLVDLSGTVLQKHTRTLPQGTHRIPMYADVPAGTYIITATSGKTVGSSRLMKL